MAWLIPLTILLILAGCGHPTPETADAQVSQFLGGAAAGGFARATEPRPLHFPEDHGPHPEYRNEWWYITGNLQSDDGRDFGFQATFFRIALRPQSVVSPSAWRTSQVWMAHAALSDLSKGRHLTDERFARQGTGLAGARIAPLQVWLESWRLEGAEADDEWRLEVPAEGFGLTFRLRAVSPIILQGEQGFSQKSSERGNASYYYSIPRLEVTGQVRQGEENLDVKGLAWLDREWSTSALGPDQAGWDWFSLQLADGRNLMYYQLRGKDGSIDPHSSGSLSDSDGLRAGLNADRLHLTPLAYWNSGRRRYPVEWRIELAGEGGPWRVRALMEDQEMRLSVHYWEGAVEVVDEASGKAIGRGYLEMAGY